MAADDFNELALKCLPDVHRWAYHLCRCPHWAEDLTQETYTRAFSAADKYDPARGPVRPWLFAIAYRVYLHHCRRRQRESAAQEDLANLQRQATPAPRPEAQLQSEESTRRIQQVVASLPDSQRVVVTLWAMEGMKYREIARILGVPLGTVMSRLHRARAFLAQQLDSLAPAASRPSSLAGDAQDEELPEGHPTAS